MNENNGGQAFPSADDGDRIYGMTLRDYFAAQALPVILKSWGASRNDIAEIVATHAYSIADAMIAAREA